jgi:hypothetical protein
MAGGLFNKLKSVGKNVEYVQEFAKTLTWEKNFKALAHQSYVTGVQMYTQNMLVGQVEAIITDSPILIGLMYYAEPNKKIKKLFEEFIIESFKSQNNLNFFLNRVKDYNKAGRNQTLNQAKVIDMKTKSFLKRYEIPYIEIDGNDEGLSKAFNAVVKILGKGK